MEVSFTPESFVAYSNGKELADQRTFLSNLVALYENDPQPPEAADLAHAIADMAEIGDKVDNQDLELSDDNTPFEKLSYSTFRLERRFFDGRTIHHSGCDACALRGRVAVCNAAPCSPFYRNDVPMRAFFAIIPASRAASSGKKGYVPDTPDSFDFSPENWNSVKAFIGM